jgi:hypothetical protein
MDMDRDWNQCCMVIVTDSIILQLHQTLRKFFTWLFRRRMDVVRCFNRFKWFSFKGSARPMCSHLVVQELHSQ